MLLKKSLFAAALLAAGTLGTTAMAASPATAQFQVSLTVVAACTVATPSSINLGTAPTGSSQNYTGNTAISVTCPSTIPFTVGLKPGNGNANGAGVLTSGANTIAYNLYSDSGYSNAWGNTAGTNTQAGTGNGATAVPFTAYAKVASSALATAVAGSYSDTVTVNVNY